MHSIRLSLALCCLPLAVSAQSGPWARYDSLFKAQALVREADGGSLAEVESIVKGGGSVNAQLEPTGLSPLMAAASGGRAAVVTFLIEHGAQLSLKDSNGLTALDRAKLAGASDVVRLLTQTAGGAAPVTPVATAPAASPVPVPVPAQNTPIAAQPKPVAPGVPDLRVKTRAPASRWAPFGSFAVGDKVLFFAGSWKVGVVREVGVVSQERGRYAAPTERKYRISPVDHPDWSDWVDWGYVASAVRDPSWTGFFVGEWALGEVMAVNSRVEGADLLTQYSFYGASEALRILPGGTFEWKQPRQPVIRGRWIAAPDGPGIILQGGARGKEWTFRNETNATEENIRSIESARLTTPGVMSIKAKRPMAVR